MTESNCLNISHKKDGSRFCKFNENEIQGLQRQVDDLSFRLKRAREVYVEMKKIAEREERLDQTLRNVFKELTRMRITVGADVGDLRNRLEKAKEMIEEGLNS